MGLDGADEVRFLSSLILAFAVFELTVAWKENLGNDTTTFNSKNVKIVTLIV